MQVSLIRVIFGSTFVDQARIYIDPCRREELKALLTFIEEFASKAVQVCKTFKFYHLNVTVACMRRVARALADSSVPVLVRHYDICPSRRGCRRVAMDDHYPSWFNKMVVVALAQALTRNKLRELMSFVLTAYSTPDRLCGHFDTPYTEMMHQLYPVAVFAAMFWFDASMKDEIKEDTYNPFGPNADLIMDLSPIFKQIEGYVRYTSSGHHHFEAPFKMRPDLAFWGPLLNLGERTHLRRVPFLDRIEYVLDGQVEEGQEHRVQFQYQISKHIVRAKFLQLADDEAAARDALKNEPKRDKPARIVGTDAIRLSFTCPLCAPTGSFYCYQCQHRHPPEDKSKGQKGQELKMCRHCTWKRKYIAPSAPFSFVHIDVTRVLPDVTCALLMQMPIHKQSSSSAVMRTLRMPSKNCQCTLENMHLILLHSSVAVCKIPRRISVPEISG